MDARIAEAPDRGVAPLAMRQHGVAARRQLEALGLDRGAARVRRRARALSECRVRYRCGTSGDTRDDRARAAFERDRERDATLGLAGLRVLRFSHRQIVERPGLVAAALRSSA
jgi:hypothetical protein